MKRVLVLSVILALGACENASYSDRTLSTKDTASLGFYPDDQLLVSAKMQFRERNYGKSYKLFKEALDVVPDDTEAWLGYAASADMLRQFERADYAYRRLQPVIGQRVEFLNNYGYSMLLRGELVAARKYFLAAYEKDPSNPITANNLELLRNSVSSPKRAVGDLRGI
ncbi:hypothetical protein PVT71_20560 [Salipiger sp. H15]|uniref:Tetratricopeptide repeat protein n=1 Tax=Alloyangia sp. H15 TaxID=3029062 RepID=A0AAU8AKV2_9RHOB